MQDELRFAVEPTHVEDAKHVEGAQSTWRCSGGQGVA